MESLQNDATSLPALEFQKLVRSTRLKDDPALTAFCAGTENSRANRQTRLCTKCGSNKFPSHSGTLFEYRWQPPSKACRTLRRSAAQHRPAHSRESWHRFPNKICSAPATIPRRPRPASNGYAAICAQRARKTLGSDASQWSWGKLHTVHFRHALDDSPARKTCSTSVLCPALVTNIR